MKVPLPDGWKAALANDSSFRAGPDGHPVLRIDLRPGAGEQLPTPEQLHARLSAELKAGSVEVMDLREERDVSVLVYRLGTRADGGPAFAAFGLLGAKRVGADLFLCSTTPGTSLDEVNGAAAACEGLSVPAR